MTNESTTPSDELPGTSYFENLSKESWSYPDFRYYLISATEYLPISESRMPVYIDTGLLGNELDSINKETVQDPKHRERAKFVKLGLSKEILIPIKPDIGDIHSVVAGISISHVFNIRKGFVEQEESLIGVMHTHPTESSPSPIDFSSLVGTLDSGGHIFAMLANPHLKLLFLRTLETENTSPQSVQQWVNLNDNLVNLKLRGASGNARLLEINKFIGNLCKQHHISVYSSVKGNVFSRSSLI